MKDELIGDGLATVQYVVHGDVLVVPVGLVCPLDAGYALGIGNAFMLSYHTGVKKLRWTLALMRCYF